MGCVACCLVGSFVCGVCCLLPGGEFCLWGVLLVAWWGVWKICLLSDEEFCLGGVLPGVGGILPGEFCFLPAHLLPSGEFGSFSWWGVLLVGCFA